MLPVIICNGTVRWSAATSLAQLFMPMSVQLRGYQHGQNTSCWMYATWGPESLELPVGRRRFSCVLRDQNPQKRRGQSSRKSLTLAAAPNTIAFVDSYTILFGSLTTRLRERFGSISKFWTVALSNLKEPQQIIDLTGTAYTAQTSDEFESVLMKCVVW